jgi:hypothetical protein
MTRLTTQFQEYNSPAMFCLITLKMGQQDLGVMVASVWWHGDRQEEIAEWSCQAREAT